MHWGGQFHNVTASAVCAPLKTTFYRYLTLQRPKTLDKLCLADFVAWYNCVKDVHADRNNEPSVTGLDEFIPETNFDDNDDVPDSININELECKPFEYKLKGGLKLVKRKHPKIIKSVRYHRDKDTENHYREQIMLYTSWRNEINDYQTHQERFEQVKNDVLCSRSQYEHHSEILDKALDDMSNV